MVCHAADQQNPRLLYILLLITFKRHGGKCVCIYTFIFDSKEPESTTTAAATAVVCNTHTFSV